MATPDPAEERDAAAFFPSFGSSTVRAAVAADVAVLSAVAAETFPLACPPDATAENIQAFITENLGRDSFERYLADADREVFLAEIDGEPVGYSMIVFGDPSDPDVSSVVTARPTAELSKLYVRAGHHGAGVARVLVAACLAAAERRSCASVWLGVNNENAKANRFYEKSGFQQVGIKRFRVGDRWEDDLVRALEL